MSVQSFIPVVTCLRNSAKCISPSRDQLPLGNTQKKPDYDPPQASEFMCVWAVALRDYLRLRALSTVSNSPRGLGDTGGELKRKAPRFKGGSHSHCARRDMTR